MLLILYTWFSYFLLPFYFLRLIIRGIQDKGHLDRWNERLGICHLSRPKQNVIWIHAVSVGEVNALMPLLRSIIDQYEDFEILVTTSTLTGSNLLKSKMGDRIKHQYLPIDIPSFINNFLSFWNPSILIIIETEIWPNLISCCKKKEIYTVLVNARLSELSLNKYKYIKSLISDSISNLGMILTQYESDKKRFKELSSELKNIEVCGNLKFDYEVPSEIKIIAESIRQEWSVQGVHRPTLIAASTHEGEEEIVLEAFTEILKSYKHALLILVPRHPERFNKVLKKVLSTNLVTARRSLNEDVTPLTQVILGDTMGELSLLYSVSDLAFIGGSLIDHGGQNFLEPASLSKALCSGPSLRNFEEISNLLLERKALKIVSDKTDLKEHFETLISFNDLLTRAGEAANEVFLSNKGASNKVLKKLEPHLKQSLKISKV